MDIQHVPRERGDEPSKASIYSPKALLAMFPASAGMNRINTEKSERPKAPRMFPASAGMNRWKATCIQYQRQFNVPRERGDEPP